MLHCLLLLAFLSLLQITAALLPPCATFDACAARVTTFAPLHVQPPPREVDSVSSPLYDSFFPEQHQEDYDQTLSEADFPLCACHGSRECTLDDEKATIQLDRHVRIAFCQEVTEALPSRCYSRRGLIRVVGTTSPTSRAPVSVSKAIAFCTCPSGYKRLQAEPWDAAQLAFPYKCA